MSLRPWTGDPRPRKPYGTGVVIVIVVCLMVLVLRGGAPTEVAGAIATVTLAAVEAVRRLDNAAPAGSL